MITSAHFAKIFPRCPSSKARAYLPLLVAAMLEFKINSRRRVAAFLAQVGHESCDFKYMEELASGVAYEGRKDLGNVRPGDGHRFKGRGPIQITGRLNYARAAIALNLPLTERPELLSEPSNGFRAAGWFWQTNKLNLYADTLSGQGDTRDLSRFDKITYRVNGGYNGRDQRQMRYLNALSELSDANFTEASLIPPVVEHPLPQFVPQAETRPQTNSAPVAATPAPVEAATASLSFDDIPVNDETKAFGKRAATKLGARLSGAVLSLWGMGAHGRLLVILAVCAVLIILYFERRHVVPAVRAVLARLK